MNKTAIIDIDDTLGPSPFKNIAHNDNGLLRTPEFMKKLREMDVYEWVEKWDWKQYDDITVITGRLAEWNVETAAWMESMISSRFDFLDVYGCATGRLVNVEWDDSLPSREASYQDYVMRKTLKIMEVACDAIYNKYSVDIFEDSTQVMQNITDWTYIIPFTDFYLVRDGKLQKYEGVM